MAASAPAAHSETEVFMPRRIALAFCLAFVAPLVACNGTERVTGTPSSVVEGNSVASMAPKITKSLTVSGAEAAFGIPNLRTTIPPIVLTYLVEDGKKVSLTFPDMVGVITSALLTDRNSVVTSLPILDK
jgi:hypothetical protein